MKQRNAEFKPNEHDLRAYCNYLEALVEQNAINLIDHRRVEEELRETGSYLENVLENSPDPIGIVDRKGRLIKLSRVTAEVLGYDFEELKGKSAFDLYPDKDELERMLRKLRNEGVVTHFEITLERKDGSIIPFEVSLSLLRDDRGKIVGSVCVARDLSQLKETLATLERTNERLREANRMLQQLSLLDALTSIPNRRYFEEYFNQEWRRAARNRKDLSLVMVDIDHFKAFNDTYGHQAGDECLKQVARALNSVLKRQSDFVARYGGEEFAIVLPDTDLNGAVLLAEKMLEQVITLQLEHSQSDTSEWLTISAGVASTVPRPGANQAVLVAEADHALYQAKQSGRQQMKWRSIP